MVKFYPLTVSEVIDETAHARSFRFRPAAGHAPLFDYRPGQFLTFRIPCESGHIERCYSLSSAPACDAELKVTVKRVSGGIGSNWFNDVPKPGDTIEVAPPSGRFVLRSRERQPVLFAGGSGITPVISLIKQTLHETALAPRLFYANTDHDQIIFRDEIAALGAGFPGRFECHRHIDAQSGLADAGTIADFVGGRPDCDFYICGPAPFMDLAEDVLAEMGVGDGHVFIERFTIPEDSDSDTVMESPAAGADGVQSFRATIDGEEHEVPYAAGETMLRCMLSQGLDPVYSCEDAHCGSCMVIRKTGAVAMRKSTILSKRDKERGYILLCQAEPQSDDVWVDCDA